MGRGDELHGEDILLAGPSAVAEDRIDVGLARAVELLESCGGNVSRAASRAGLPRTTFRRRLEEAALAARARRGPGHPARVPDVGARPRSAASRSASRLGRRPSPLAAELRDVLALEVAEQADDFLTAE
jgi:transposase-like protein